MNERVFNMVDLESETLEWKDLPMDESFVEVLLDDGTVVPAFFSKNLIEPGDWDFSNVVDNEPGDETLSDRVVGWRER